MLRRDDEVGGRYRLLARAGAGGMATVYRARDQRLRREVAVKVIAEELVHDPLFVSRFRREAQLGARLAHPNVVGVLDAGEEPRDFIAMEFVDGMSAGALVKTQGPLTTAHAIRIIASVCDALTHAHQRNVVHRDVTPGNILISRSDGAVKLADFGLASDPTDLASEPMDVHAGPSRDVTGTPGYVAPEILRGAAPSPRSDVYSLGVVTHRLLTGPPRIRPLVSESTRPVMTSALQMPPLAELRPGLPRVLSQAVDRAVSDDPDARQSSVAEFHAQIAA